MTNKEEQDIIITDIFWDRIYLHIIVEAKSLQEKKIYLFFKDIIIKEIMLENISDNKYKAVINITNIEKGKMLKNGVYSFKILNQEEYVDLPITNQVGYKLDDLDRIYRYKNYYAYTASLKVKTLIDERISFTLKSMFMIADSMPLNLKIRKVLIKASKALFGFMYKIFNFVHPNKKNKVLLMSETRSPISGNLKALNERIKEREIDKKCKISYSFNKTLESNPIKLLFNWIKLSWKISKQETIFIDDYSPIFAYIKLSKKTKLIQVWHAGVGFKSVGYARFGFTGPEPYASCHRKYDYAIVGSEALIPVYAEVFGIDKEKILPYGLPRLDNYLNKENIEAVKKTLYNSYPMLKDKKVILFAPTFRGKGQKQAYYPYEKIDLEGMFKLCEQKDIMFLIKMHPFVKEKIQIPEKYKSRIMDFSDYKDINDLLYITDLLITDYSSNIYDFSLLNRPILFYTYDLEKYELINKVHRPIKECAPGKVCYTFDEVLKAIYEEDFEIEKLQKYKEENVNVQKQKASDLIIDNLILKGENND